MSSAGDTAIKIRTVLGLRPYFKSFWRGFKKWRSFSGWSRMDPIAQMDKPNSLLEYFNNHKEGRGIWKFLHYFEIYERYFSRFRGTEVHVLEVGVYSGGSLEMWRQYFGPLCSVYGVDIAPNCKAYEDSSVRIFTGDQSDRSFWRNFKKEVPVLDIIIDDGGHAPEQQIATIEELLPHLRPGGIYLCEDIISPFNSFASYLCGMAQNLNAIEFEEHLDDNERRQVCKSQSLQTAVSAIHFYPYLAVVERSAGKVCEMVAPKRGTSWEPFLT